MPSVKLNRTFHPVGQGSFFTEEILVNNKCKFAIVYDCGATERYNKNNLLQDTVKEFSSKVDYIVLSHLHDDHINGVRFLQTERNMTKILLPKLTRDREICVTVHNCLSAYESHTSGYYRTYAEVEQYLQEKGKLVHIPLGGNANVKQDTNAQENRSISSVLSLTDEGCILSLNDSKIGLKWKYKFRNAQSNDETKIVSRLKCIPEIMYGSEIDEEKIVNAFFHNDEGVIAKIANAYGPSAKRNQTSLMMFSGPCDPESFRESFTREISYPLLCHRSIFSANEYYKLSCCLYCGDLSLNAEKNAILQYYKEEWKYIEIIQVPHHGAMKDFDNSLVAAPKVFFVSYGTKNKYNHPNSNVTTAIVNSGCLLFYVNEMPSTRISYNIRIV